MRSEIPGTGINKRTHQLSTGEEIWDMAGNVWKWVDGGWIAKPRDYWQEYSSFEHRVKFWISCQ